MADKKIKKLTAKESSSIEYYTNPGSESVDNWTQSYKQAYKPKYRGWQANAGRVHRKDYIKQAIALSRARYARTMDVTAEEIVQALRQLAGLDGSVAGLNNQEKIRSLELLGRYKAMFTDNIADKTVQPAPITEADRQALANAAKALTRPKLATG